MAILVSKPYEALSVGDTASLIRTLTQRDILAFAGASGDVNPAHLDRDYAAGSIFHGVIGHGLWTGALVSAVLGTKLPGPGTIYLSQAFSFVAPVRVGDTLTVAVTVTTKEGGRRVRLGCRAVNQDDEVVLEGEAVVLAPEEAREIEAPDVPPLLLPERGERLEALIAEATTGPRVKVAVVHPVDDVSLRGALIAARDGLIEPILIGPRRRIEAAAEAGELPLDGLVIEDVPHSHAAGVKAAELAGAHEVEAIMKGALHTDEVLEPIIDRKHGLRTERRLSHVFVMDAPSYAKLLLVTDAAVNIAPTLTQKADILRNAASLAHALGIDRPKAAILSAVETVTESIPSTVDAAALCKMVERGQIGGVVADGPLAFDNAVSPAAAALKGLKSEVAGNADILLVPDLEAGNIMAKQLDYLGGAVAAGIVLGARVPIILTSRAEGELPRRASCALASLVLRRER